VNTMSPQGLRDRRGRTNGTITRRTKGREFAKERRDEKARASDKRAD